MSSSPLPSSRLLNVTSIALKILIFLNLACVVFFIGLMIFSFVVQTPLTAQLTKAYGASAPELVVLLRTILLAGLACIWPVHIALTRLRAIIGSIGEGQAFSLANAARIKLIGWALLATQLLDLCFGAIAWRARSLEHGPVFDWQPSVTAWLAVLLLFILAKVFEQGAIMRDEIEGTV